MRWQVCPVCEGKGIVPNGFYSYPVGQGFTSSSTAVEKCNSCQGTGMVVEPIDMEQRIGEE